MRTRLTDLLLLLLLCTAGAGQEVLTLDKAILFALEKNFDVLAARNLTTAADLRNNLGAAGMSPTVSLNGNLNNSNLNSYQVFNNGTVQDRPGASAKATTASINVDWLVFDGLRMFAVKKRLSLSEEYSSIQLRQQMENTVYDVMVAYYNVIRINELMKAAEQNLALYEERRKVAELRLEVGADSRVDLLLSKCDENRARAGILQLQLDLLNTKINLNTLLGRGVQTDFKVEDTIVVSFNPSLDELKKTSYTGNSSLMLLRKNEEIAFQDVKEARSSMFPFVTFNGSYSLNRQQSQAGFVLENRQQGLYTGLNVRWVLFNGGRNRNLIKERNVLAMNQRLFTERAQLQVDGQVYVNYQAFLLNKQVVEWELRNLEDSRTVQAISLERYKTGRTGLLETVETQKNLEDAQVRFVNALYNTKIAEANLLRVNGSLVK